MGVAMVWPYLPRRTDMSFATECSKRSAKCITRAIGSRIRPMMYCDGYVRNA
jgi:hypothetical protein